MFTSPSTLLNFLAFFNSFIFSFGSSSFVVTGRDEPAGVTLTFNGGMPVPVEPWCAERNDDDGAEKSCEGLIGFEMGA